MANGRLNYEDARKETRKTEALQSGRDLSEQNIVATYLNSLRQFPQLKHEEVVDLFKSYNEGCARDKDGEVISRTPDAVKIRKKLAECNLRLVVSIAKQYKGHNIPIEDLIQEGNIGLMKSIERFKWQKGFRFSTYATWWIKQAIGQHVLKRKRIIRLPAHAASVQRKMLQAAEEYREVMGCEPTSEELQELIGASETVVNATMHSGRGTISLQQPLSASGEGDTIGDKIEDDRSGSDPFDNVAEKQLLEITKRVLGELSAKEAAILRLRFGLVEDSTNSAAYPITEEEMSMVMKGKGIS
jgi:RNA polymerase sigma factor (sigma-70 family)